MTARRHPESPGAARSPRQAHCPICREPVAPTAPCFPFCSRRCKLIDLGRWLGGEYRIEEPLEGPDRQGPPGADDEGTP
ncbi:MAG: DNA gyrase inhibitor YacG [Planctomycetota bacterium]